MTDRMKWLPANWVPLAVAVLAAASAVAAVWAWRAR